VGPLYLPAMTYGAYEYWHQNESAFDNASLKDPLTVQAGQKLSNINFILNNTSPRFDQFEDGEVLLRQPVVAPFIFRGLRRPWHGERAS
jgi:hypothetical protein